MAMKDKLTGIFMSSGVTYTSVLYLQSNRFALFSYYRSNPPWQPGELYRWALLNTISI